MISLIWAKAASTAHLYPRPNLNLKPISFCRCNDHLGAPAACALARGGVVVWQMSALGEARQLGLAGNQVPLMRNGNAQLNAPMNHGGATATILRRR